MDLNQPPLIRIYKSCQLLMSIKRRLFGSLKVQSLPHSPFNQEKRTISSKVYLYLKKVTKQIRNQLLELAQNQHGEEHIEIVDRVITSLRDNNEFLSQEQKLIIDAHQIIKEWNDTEDPLIYYQQGVRKELRSNLNGKLESINTFSVACRETKKPLYVRKLERELKDNMNIIAENERRYNLYQYGVSISVKKKVMRLLAKLLENLGRRTKSNFVEVDKNLLLSHYIDVFHGRDVKLTEMEIKNYRKDLLNTARTIGTYFHEEKQCFEGLLSFIREMEKLIDSFHKQLLSEEDHIFEQISEVSSDINHIVNFEEALEIINSSKIYFISSSELSDFKTRIPNLRYILEDSIAEIGQFSKNILKREVRNRNKEIAQFIEDKKFLQSLVRKEDTFELALFDALGLFMQKLQKSRSMIQIKSLEREDVKKFKCERAIMNIFDNYFQEIENKERSSEGKSTINLGYKLSVNQQKEVREIEQFNDNLVVFEDDVDWNSSFQCSLGPKLLIHGKMRILTTGIYYYSNFNKKNYFFGKTRIFIPKEEIYEINKNSAFMLFDDVIEVVTKKGVISFHALGKREKMITELNENFFPEGNIVTSDPEAYQFNQFKGNLEQVQTQVAPFLQNLEFIVGEGDIPNISLRSYFHKYQSEEEEFHYQGKVYQSFKQFSLNLAGGSNIQKAKFSPGVPFYMQLVGTGTATESDEDLQVSERFFTYKKELPVVPFVSKGGFGICQEKYVYRWGGPKCFVSEINTTVSGISITEGMVVRSKAIYEERKNNVHYQLSGEVTFETNSAMNSMVRAPALSKLKEYQLNLLDIIKKMEKTKKASQGGKVAAGDQIEAQYEQRIAVLLLENAKLKKLMTRSLIVAIVLYAATVLVLIY